LENQEVAEISRHEQTRKNPREDDIMDHYEIIAAARKMIPAALRKRVQGNALLSEMARRFTKLLLTVGGRVQTVRHGPGTGIRLILSEHLTEVYLSGRYEPETQAALAYYLKPGGVMYDLGASIGFFSLLGGKIVGPGGRVYSVEPAPHAWEVLNKQIAVNGFHWITPLQECLADRRQEVTFAITGNAYGSSIVETEHKEWPTTKMITTTVDELVYGRSFIPPTLMKIDVEDKEGEVLLGADRTIRECKPLIICECHSSKSGKDVRSLLMSRGYTGKVLGDADGDWKSVEELREGEEKRIIAIPG
jgi:FkbM family methyltransferase